MKGRLTAVTLCFLGVLAAGPVHAQVSDAVGDFLPTYTGIQGGDLDVISANVTFLGDRYLLTATLNAAVGTTTGATYIFGFDRGQGTERLTAASPSVGQGVFFDSVVTLRPDSTVSINRIVGGGATNLPAGSATISGNVISAFVGLNELPALGLTPQTYTWNLWPRLGAGNNNQISDFAPNASNAPVVVASVAPEPASLALLLPGVGMLCRLGRRRKK